MTASQQEFIYFHLPPVSDWKDECSGNYRKTVFGLSCYRQIAANELLNKTSDVTRSTVQKSVVVLASEPFLGSIRSKLGMVTEAFFAQKDFSKTEILQHLYESLNTSFPVPLSDSTMFMGASLRELVYKFRQRTLPLFKLLLLGKRILFFGQKVERLTCYQYSLISLIPHLIRNISSSAANTLDLPTIYPQTSTNISDRYNAKIKRFNLPLKIFGKGAVWLPYIPLQQIDVLLSTDTKSFVIGSSNAIFMNHSACAIDAVVNTDAGTLEFRDPYLSSLLSLTSADKRFIEEIVKTVISTWTDNEIDNTNIPQIEFEGSDDDIRSRFEMYLLSLLVSVKAMKEQQPKTKDFFSDYNTQYIKALQSSPAFSEWERTTSTQALKEGIPNGGFAVNPGHPYSGTSAISAMQLSITSKFSELTRSVSSGKVMSGAESSLKGVVDVVTDPASHAKVHASANQFFSSVCSWYSQKKSEWISNPTVGQNESESESASPIDQYVMLPGEAAKDNDNDK